MFVKFKWTFILLLLTPILLVLSFFVAGLGIGWTLLPTAIIFPFGVYAMTALNATIYVVAILGIVQLPIYGYLIDSSRNKKRKIFILAAIHSVFLLFLVITQSAQF